MRKISLLLCTALFVTLLINSCKSSDDEGVIIQGQVVNEQTREPVIDALVQITDPGEFSNTFTRTDSTGQYSLGALEILEITDLSITVSATNFTEVNRTLKVTPKDQITGFNFELPADQSGDGDDGDDDGPSGPSGGAAAIQLAELSSETINIAATGGNTSSTITFEVQDSSGNSIDLVNAIDVEFSIVSGPGGGEEITPLSVTTNAQGKASATLKSGNTAGVVKVQARIERTIQKFSPLASVSNKNLNASTNSLDEFDNTTPSMDNNKIARKVISEQVVITSEPVAITIHGGFPDANHFSISTSNLNYEYVQGLQVPISVLVGDEFSNPVTPGTAVYFNTSSGVIAGSAEDHTDEEGKATVNLNPNGTGNTTVTATTIDKDDQEIQQSLNLLFSSSKANIVATDELSLNPGESTSIDFTVTDRNGNPMASGTSIQVSTEGSITLSGTTSTTLGDELSGGSGITSFTFNASVGEGFSGSQNVTITVTSPSGVTTNDFITINSTGGVVAGDPEAPASMELVSLANEAINIAESGGITNTAFTFQVQDSAGRALNSESAVDVEFSILSNPGGASITPTQARTDAQGRVTSNLNAGNTAGVAQIQARVVGTSITSKPVAVAVHGGFPVASNFSLSSANLNYELSDPLRIPVNALLGDAFSNPVKPGTAVYFSTDNGVIDGSAQGHTDDKGQATVELNPENLGSGTVTATTVNQDSTEITSTLDLLFTTSKADITSDFNDTEIVIAGGDNQSVDFTVTDKNGNPMAAGTSVSVTSQTSALSVSGSTSQTIEDALTGGDQITDFSFNINAAETFSGSANIIIKVTSPGGVITNQALVVATTGGVVTGDPEEPASMELVGLSNETINIAESGGTTNSTFTFQVQDSAGRALDSQSAVDVEFSILSNPGGASITPITVTTDAQGRATSNLNAGNTAGVVQIQAQVVGTSIVSKPVAVTIHGGFPDANHFTLEPLTETNIEGFDRNGASITYKVRAGDEFSNPVKPGTAVYFETTGGVIDGSGTGHTDETGYTEVTLYAGNPRPGNGQGVVTAKTTDANGNEISQTSPFIFSTSKANITPDITELELGPDESFDVGYEVIDLNGNPMPAGTRIEVTPGGNGGVNLTGVTSYIMPNELSTGQGTTDFSFTATAASNFSKSETIYITATSPSGTVTTNSELTIYGTGGGVSGTPSAPAAIVLEDVQRNTINIKETGGIVNSSLTFQVQDSAGRPLDLDSPVDVEFEIIQGPGGGEGVLPAVATTNSTGRVTTNVFSGNTAGVLQIQARIEPPFAPSTIRSNPVAITIHGGFPDFDHFSIAPTVKNIEGFNINGTTTTLEVIVGDKFSNPVKPGTAVYFETTGGVIEGSAVDHTDALGRASVTLQSGNPRGPLNDGDLTVTARTIDENSQFIERTASVVFSTSAANISTPDAMPFDTLAPGGGATFDYVVQDLNGNPMAAGTRIEIDGGAGIEVTGDANFTLGDHINPGPGATEFQFSIRDTDEESSAAADITLQIRVTTPSGNVTTFSGIYGVRRLVNDGGTPVNTN